MLHRRHMRPSPKQDFVLASREQESREPEVIAVIQDLVQELHPERAKFMDVNASSRLERDLGIDSLARTELILRIETAFGMRLAAGDSGAAKPSAIFCARWTEARHPKPSVKAVELGIAPLPLVPAAVQARTLVGALEWHSAMHPDRLHLTVIDDEAAPLMAFTYRGLTDAARETAQGLIERDVMPSDRIALMLPTGRDFFIAFFAILYAGAVPVPIYPPMRLSQLEEHLRRQAGILSNAGARILITDPEGSKKMLQPISVSERKSSGRDPSVTRPMAACSALSMGGNCSFGASEFSPLIVRVFCMRRTPLNSNSRTSSRP